MSSNTIIGRLPTFCYDPNVPLCNVTEIAERKDGVVVYYSVIQQPISTEDDRIDKMQRTTNKIDQM